MLGRMPKPIVTKKPKKRIERGESEVLKANVETT